MREATASSSFYDQIVPGSTLLGYLNADHWALYVAIGRSHQFISGRRLLYDCAQPVTLFASLPAITPSWVYVIPQT